MTKILNLDFWYGGEAIVFAPVENATLETLNEVSFQREDLILKRSLSKYGNFGWKCQKGPNDLNQDSRLHS